MYICNSKALNKDTYKIIINLLLMYHDLHVNHMIHQKLITYDWYYDSRLLKLNTWGTIVYYEQLMGKINCEHITD